MEVNSKRIAELWAMELKERRSGLTVSPKLTVVHDANCDEASKRYMTNKKKRCAEFGIEMEEISIDTNSNEIYSVLSEELKGIDNPVIVQLPFKGVDANLVGEYLQSLGLELMDVDGFSPMQQYYLSQGSEKALPPCTALGCMRIMKYKFKNDLAGKTACIVNRSNLIGKPLIQMCLNENMGVKVHHSKSYIWNMLSDMINSDIIITGCGQRGIFSKTLMEDKDRCKLIIDCSMTRKEGWSGVGDWDKESILEDCPQVDIASGYNQTGLLTTYALIDNIIKSYELRNLIK